MDSIIFMDQEETPLARDVQAKKLLQRFEEDQNLIFVIYSIAPDFQEIVRECEQIFQAAANRLYLSVNMEAEKRETPGDTLFEVMHQILDLLLDKVHHNEDQLQLFQMFRMLENLKKRTYESDPEDKLAEFMGFAESVCYPNLIEILSRREQTCIIGLTRFEHVMEWGSKIRNFLVDRLLKRSMQGQLRFIVFARSAEQPTLFYGSNKEGSERQVTFHKLNEGLKYGEQETEYKDNYRKELV
ncbi:hypothetical protein U27_00051 [Candidatus Vecturithrix granuli]|uniref:Uncharacterized protein n=1 Tax=Vecturithrix granuli TaxID=1499967 RepID=A0A081C6F5_VECG1|nr:hypothetical protein U27_00051 [Candidatus Vecturithrix granuli]